ncbi:FAD-binding oxidoreductase [Nonomuraea longicatena]|uniref:FAD-binding oxidoreductase n=1 Tax=Nonomuraea longicatena TaxID=83682 RepID=A0ABN1Q6J7_9ACTN
MNITADHESYDRERTGFQLAVRHRPEVIFAVESAADVRTAVAHAAARDLPVAVQATGHGVPHPGEGGVLITTSRLTGVRVDPEAGTAWVAAGTRWRQVVEAAAPYGLAPLSGSAPDVSVVGYTLGGGLGIMARQYGYAADHVRAVEVVTADAEHRRVTADDDTDLFWALRGGRGAFGVVTGLEFDLFPVRTLYGGGLYFADFDAVHAWREWTADLPEELTTSVAVIPYPDVPALPEPLRGRRVVHVRIAYTGTVADGEDLVAPLRAFGPRLLDTLGELPYSRSETIYNDPTEPAAVQGSHTLLHTLPPEAVETARAATEAVVEFRHLGGALARDPKTPNAVGNRDAAYLAQRITRGADVPDVHAHLEKELRPWATGGQMLNFVSAAHATPEAIKAAFTEEDYARLQHLKSVRDPANLLRHTHTIPPRG